MKVLIATNHLMLAEGWSAFLQSPLASSIRVSVCDILGALRQAKSRQPDHILLDLWSAGADGQEWVKEIRSMAGSARITVLLKGNEQIADIDRLRSIGVLGFLNRRSGMEEMQNCIRQTTDGNSYYSAFIYESDTPGVKSAVRASLADYPFSRKELAVARMMIMGLCSRRMGEILRISQRTVENYRCRILRKMHLKKTTALVEMFTGSARHSGME